MQHELTLGGQKRTLRFTMGTLKHIGRISGKDPISFGHGLTDDPGNLYKVVETIIHAALTMQYEKEKKNVDFTAEDVEDWVSDMNMSEAIKMIGIYTQAFSGEETSDPNEVKKVAKK